MTPYAQNEITLLLHQNLAHPMKTKMIKMKKMKNEGK